MPYAFVDELSVADLAFRAWGRSLEETFTAAAEAVMNTMVEDLSTIQPRETRALTVEDEALDILLFNFLQEFVYYKDAEQLLLRIRELHVDAEHSPYTLSATVVGEPIDPQRHPMRIDVKAVTLHHFSLSQTERGWETTVILDV